jgi:hypothetical protein
MALKEAIEVVMRVKREVRVIFFYGDGGCSALHDIITCSFRVNIIARKSHPRRTKGVAMAQEQIVSTKREILLHDTNAGSIRSEQDHHPLIHPVSTDSTS